MTSYNFRVGGIIDFHNLSHKEVGVLFPNFLLISRVVYSGHISVGFKHTTIVIFVQMLPLPTELTAQLLVRS